MESLNHPQQTNSTWAQDAHVCSFPQVQDIPALSVSPISLPFELETQGDVLYSTPEQQELNVNGKETSSAVFTLEDQVKHIFTFYNPIRLEEVQGFLEENPFLIPLLFATYLNIRKHFSYSQITLGVETDYEYPNHQELAVHVITILPLEEAYKQLKQFDEQWYIKISKQAKSRFYVNLEFE